MKKFRRVLVEGTQTTTNLLPNQANLSLAEPEINDFEAIPERFFHTQPLESLPQANDGDYSFNSFGPLKILEIKNGAETLPVVIRESTRNRGLYRIVNIDKATKRMTQSAMLFSAPQISAMMRVAHHPTPNMRVSGMTAMIPKEIGLIILQMRLLKNSIFCCRSTRCFYSCESGNVNRIF